MMLYIHIPFCASKCAYCDFYSRPMTKMTWAKEYIDVILKEWRLRQHEVQGPVTTLYLGGGTPSIMPRQELERLFAALPLTDAVEITMEANPEQIDQDFMKWIESTPVNRLSIGIQSFDDRQLSIVGRRHNADRARQAIEAIKASAICNYSLDLIYGLPGQNLESWKQNLDEMMTFRPPHLSCYMLSYEQGTRLDALRIAGKITPTDDDELAEMYEVLCETARNNGYDHYEISNFALPGFRAIHNTNYWLDRPYVGLGASAHSFDGKLRRVNPADLKTYLAMTDRPVYMTEEENDVSRHNDLILTSLRISDGLSLSSYMARFGKTYSSQLLKSAQKYIDCGKMIIADGRLRITEKGWLVSDSIMLDLFVD